MQVHHPVKNLFRCYYESLIKRCTNDPPEARNLESRLETFSRASCRFRQTVAARRCRPDSSLGRGRHLPDRLERSRRVVLIRSLRGKKRRQGQSHPQVLSRSVSEFPFLYRTWYALALICSSERNKGPKWDHRSNVEHQSTNSGQCG